ncbi:MAG: V-type ATP synthase subunit D [Candidatus Omnitrophota bacterium]
MSKIQYNKTYLIQINKDLKIRENALPVLKSKEAALRAEIKKIRTHIIELDKKIEAVINSYANIDRLWVEFSDIVKLDKINFKPKKIASITVDVVDAVIFDVADLNLFSYPAWIYQGIEILKQIIRLKAERINEAKILDKVEYARRKTTQKVNLYEKVQIPFFEESIRKIKRFLEDEENLSKSSQKVVKKRMEEVAVA